MSTSQIIYAIADRAPEFPAWLWNIPDGGVWEHFQTTPFSVEQFGWKKQCASGSLLYSHWVPDQLERPLGVPSLQAETRTNATLKAMQGGRYSTDERHPLYVLAAELEASEADLIRRNEELTEAANRWKEYYRAAYGHPWESRNRNYQGL